MALSFKSQVLNITKSVKTLRLFLKTMATIAKRFQTSAMQEQLLHAEVPNLKFC
jgi:hypothetical protein